MTSDGPQVPRSPGRLRYGNQSGDPSKAPRCGAKTRQGTACRGPAVRGKRRCRLHGGLSTGPKTAEGLERCRTSALKSGYWSAEARAARREVRELIQSFEELLDKMDDAG